LGLLSFSPEKRFVKQLHNLDIEQLQKDVNTIFNRNPSNTIKSWDSKPLPRLINQDSPSDDPPSNEAPRVQFKIDFEEIIPEDIPVNYLPDECERSRILTRDGMSLGGRIVMGDPNDKAFDLVPDGNGGYNKAKAYHVGNTIVLNPDFYDRTSADYHGFDGSQTVKNKDGTTTILNWSGTASQTIAHEIGHDFGLDHPDDSYPETGNMSNKGSRIPTQAEIDQINHRDNEHILQPREQ